MDNAIAEFLDRIINYCLLRANGSTPAVMTFMPRDLWGEAKNIPFGILLPLFPPLWLSYSLPSDPIVWR